MHLTMAKYGFSSAVSIRETNPLGSITFLIERKLLKKNLTVENNFAEANRIGRTRQRRVTV